MCIRVVDFVHFGEDWDNYALKLPRRAAEKPSILIMWSLKVVLLSFY
jgi:hypothetical protein